MENLLSLKCMEIDIADVLDASPDLVCIPDPEHNIIHANQTMTNALGVSHGALTGSKCF